MKKILALVLVLLLFTSVSFATSAFDLSGLTFDELIALKDQINLAIWSSDEWQEVEVPQGVWKVGEDIPAGHWTIKTNAYSVYIQFCDVLDISGKEADIGNSDLWYNAALYSTSSPFYDEQNCLSEIDFVLKDDIYVVVDGGNVIFTPYTGKPSLGFK